MAKNKKKSSSLSKSKVKGYGSYNYYNSGTNDIIEEPFSGAWQRNIEARFNNGNSNFAYFSCQTLTANDISKLDLNVKVFNQQKNVWLIDYSRKYRYLRDLMEHPNAHQNSQDFISRWVHSLQSCGNTFVFVDWQDDTPIGMYILDPKLVEIERDPDGNIWYILSPDNVIGLKQRVVLTSREIIHHRINTFYDDLCGFSPLVAAAIHVYGSIEQLMTSNEFFKNSARPSGLLIAPADVNEDEVKQLKLDYNAAMSGRKNAGRIFVMSGGVQYQQLSVNAADQQLIEQLKMNTEAICACFHVPPYMVLGNAPSYNNIEALSQDYFQKALQFIIVGIEKNLYRGLRLDQLNDDVCIDINLNQLLRMDKSTRFKTYNEAIRGGVLKPNEARAEEDLEPVEGGDQVYMQQQNYSLAALAKRDAQENPFATSNQTTPTNDVVEEDQEDDIITEEVSNELKRMLADFTRGI